MPNFGMVFSIFTIKKIKNYNDIALKVVIKFDIIKKNKGGISKWVNVMIQLLFILMGRQSLLVQMAEEDTKKQNNIVTNK